MKIKYNKKLVHRTLLFTAGHNPKYLKKSFETDADAIVFDLEDAVPYNKKEEARVILKEFLSKDLPDNRPVYVRINPLNSGLTLLDIDAVVSPNINGFVYPMAYSSRDLIAFDAQLSLKEQVLNLPKKYFDIIVLIETTESILNLKDIATASDRIVGLLFGSEDFLAEQEGEHGAAFGLQASSRSWWPGLDPLPVRSDGGCGVAGWVGGAVGEFGGAEYVGGYAGLGAF